MARCAASPMSQPSLRNAAALRNLLSRTWDLDLHRRLLTAICPEPSQGGTQLLLLHLHLRLRPHPENPHRLLRLWLPVVPLSSQFIAETPEFLPR